jgi:hypothetical protein
MKTRNRLTLKAREAVRELLDQPIEAIEKHSSALRSACELSFEETGFTRMMDRDEDAWEVLPHQYVASKLDHVDEAIRHVYDAIKLGFADDIIAALQKLHRISYMAFVEVQEFLDGAFSKMKREDWLKQPLWSTLQHAEDSRWISGSLPMLLVGGTWSEEAEDLENAFRH